jgi:HK97 family phage major capsid protein
MATQLQQIRDERNRVAVAMRALYDKVGAEKRAMSGDEQAEWDKMDAQLEAFNATEKRLEAFEARVPAVQTPAGSAQGGNAGNAGGDPSHAEVFNRFLRVGSSELSAEERAVFQKHRADMNRPELRAFSAGTSNVGGATVPQDFLNRLEIALKAYGGMLEVSEILRTDTGATLPMPSFNYTGVVATIVGEGSASSADSSTPFSTVSLGAFTYRSPLLPVSYELLQDSAFGDGYILSALGDTLGRAINAHATTGGGTTVPRGIVLDAASGKVGTTGQTLSVIVDDLIDLEHSIDIAYRKSGARWMMADSSFKVVKKLKDSQNRPLFLPGYADKAVDTILGYPITINNDVATMAANAKSILFGRLDKYKLRIVRDVSVLRLTERYADQLQVAFLLFMRADGRLLDAGTNPVKYYANSAT